MSLAGRPRGFTLIEVLVALVIVAIALGAGIKAAGALTDNAERLARVTAGQWCAENRLTALRLAKQFPTRRAAPLAVAVWPAIAGVLRASPTPNPCSAASMPRCAMRKAARAHGLHHHGALLNARGFTLVEVLVFWS